MGPPHTALRSRIAPLTALAVAAILLATLVPTADPKPPDVALCVTCGELWLRDFSLNVILFLPLGLALHLAGWRATRILAVGFCLSLAIEVTQWWIPGRFSSLSDLLSNSLGAVLPSVALGQRGVRYWLQQRPRELLLIAFLLAVGFHATQQWLLRPVLVQTWFIQRAPTRSEFVGFDGAILDLVINHYRPAEGNLFQPEVSRVGPDTTLFVAVRAQFRSLRTRRASILRMVGFERERFLLGHEGTNLLLRAGTRAIAWGLRAPTLALRGALATMRTATEPVDLLAGVHPDSVTLRACSGAGRRCAGTAVAWGPAHGWLMWTTRAWDGRWLQRLASGVWLAAPFLLPLLLALLARSAATPALALASALVIAGAAVVGWTAWPGAAELAIALTVLGIPTAVCWQMRGRPAP